MRSGPMVFNSGPLGSLCFCNLANFILAIGPGPAAKRRQALQSITKALQTMESARNCAVVLLSQCATKMQSERRPALIPSVNANVWEHGISTRIVLFKDWIPQDDGLATISLAGIQKLDGKTTSEALDHVSAFTVDTVSGRPLQFPGVMHRLTKRVYSRAYAKWHSMHTNAGQKRLTVVCE